MDDAFTALENWAEPLIARMSAGERRRLAITIGRELRRSQHTRNLRQIDADGNAYAPRKRLRDQSGKIRRNRDAKMFKRLTLAAHLRTEATADGVAVGFVGRVARVARVHQEGLVDRVSRRGPAVRYTQRKILGFSAADRDMIRTLLLQHLAGTE